MFHKFDNLDNPNYLTPVDISLVSHKTPTSQQKGGEGGGGGVITRIQVNGKCE